MQNRNDVLRHVLSRQPPVPTIFITSKALPTDTKSKTPPENLRYHLSSSVTEMQNNGDKLPIATQQRYTQHLDTQGLEQTPLSTGQPFFADHLCRYLPQIKWPWKHTLLRPISTRPSPVFRHLEDTSGSNSSSRRNTEHDIFHVLLVASNISSPKTTWSGTNNKNPKGTLQRLMAHFGKALMREVSHNDLL